MGGWKLIARDAVDFDVKFWREVNGGDFAKIIFCRRSSEVILKKSVALIRITGQKRGSGIRGGCSGLLHTPAGNRTC